MSLACDKDEPIKSPEITLREIHLTWPLFTFVYVPCRVVLLADKNEAGNRWNSKFYLWGQPLTKL